MSRAWLGDLAIAWRSLEATDDHRRTMVADLLGLTSTPNAPGESGETRDPWTTAAEPAIMYPDRATASHGPPASVREAQSTAVNKLPLLEPSSHEPAPGLTLSLGSLSRATAGPLPVSRPHDPLFPRRTAGAVIQVLLGRYTADGPLDAAAAVARLATLQALKSLPKQRRRTLRFGAQVLVDRSDSMRLFGRDQAELVQVIHGLLGKRAEVWQFTLSPLHGVTRPRTSRRQPYRVPTSDSTVLLLSDFGAVPHPNAAAGASRWEWEQFFGLIRRHQCAVVGLIPYPKNRWPAWLDEQLPLIAWDRGTTASTVQAKLR